RGTAHWADGAPAHREAAGPPAVPEQAGAPDIEQRGGPSGPGDRTLHVAPRGELPRVPKGRRVSRPRPAG
ncbi:hypothetical protein, partial [Streptomyces sp. SID14436]